MLDSDDEGQHVLWIFVGPHSLSGQGEDVVRGSGVPFAIVRPTALTEEDAGAELQIDQGDTIKVLLALPSFAPLIHVPVHTTAATARAVLCTGGADP